MELEVYKIDGSLSKEKITVDESVFGVTPNDHAIYLAVKMYLANQRQGTSKTKERGEVRGGGKKPWNQKGRGGARAGTSRSPLWKGGGTIFGPKPIDHRQSLPKKLQNVAKVSALSYKVKDSQLVVVEDFNFEAAKTKDFTAILKALKVSGKKILLLTNSYQPNVYKSGRNVDRVKILEVEKASTYEILNNQILVLQRSALASLNSSYSKNLATETTNA